MSMFSDLVTELLGSDLMEHNILHSGIGIGDALEILNRNINYCRDDCFTLYNFTGSTLLTTLIFDLTLTENTLQTLNRMQGKKKSI